MSETSKNCILFFVKDPVRGAVKSRLAAGLDDGIALELYQHFVLDMLATSDRCSARCIICVHPAGALKKIRNWLGAERHCLPQEGRDLGERMKNGFRRAFDLHYENVVLIGSDIPDLPLSLLNLAFRMLKKNDAVIGPAHDGGYYLIGFRKAGFIPDAFTGVAWGGRTVLRETLDRLKKTGCTLHRLPAWSDVDDLADVMRLLQRNKARKRACSRTISYLARIEDALKHRP